MTATSSSQGNFEPLLQGEYLDFVTYDGVDMHSARITVADYAIDADDCRDLLGMLGLLPRKESDDDV